MASLPVVGLAPAASTSSSCVLACFSESGAALRIALRAFSVATASSVPSAT